MKEIQSIAANKIKQEWVTPQLEVLDISKTMNGGDGIWQYVWGGEFWRLEMLVS
ncbi:paeninodin family lasso peptide [Paenibacillus taichungensis]|uniref:Paeninodin family lasso peptide n=1 Tax=Paenibacillus taichungensis TaxID=484184 RepID=A0ABX2MGK8_9BACL|nr:paeninodin family lasso peptide [Paenibacillus taichungensis]NUU54050.1 paeninodin family lasso peptide [Paenibacillus taichungensis]